MPGDCSYLYIVNRPGETIEKSVLIAQCKNGNRDALGILYSSYAQRMMRVVCHYVDDWQAAQDVLHDGFLIIFSRISQLKNPDSLEYWMATIMKNLSLQYLKEADITRLLDDDFEAMDIPDFEQSITMEQLEIMINRLPLGYRRVFRLAVLEHKSHKEIARILGISEQTSGSQLYHARVLLRRMINEYRLQAGMLAVIAVMCIGIWMWLQNHDVKPVITKPIADNPALSPPRTPNSEKMRVSPVPARTENESSPVFAARISNEVDSEAYASTDPYSPDETPPTREEQPDTTHYRLTDQTEQYIAEQIFDPPAPDENSGFEISLTGNWSAGQKSGQGWSVPGNPSTNDPGYQVEEDIVYRLPISVEITVAKALNSHWSIGTGVRFSHHHTDRSLEYQFNSGGSCAATQSISASYLGIPFAVRYKVFEAGNFGLSASVGAAVDFPLHASMNQHVVNVGNIPPDFAFPRPARLSFRAPVLFSVSGGVTLQYRITPAFSVYTQPTVSYTIPTNCPYPLLPTSQPWSFSLPVGISITW